MRFLKWKGSWRQGKRQDNNVVSVDNNFKILNKDHSSKIPNPKAFTFDESIIKVNDCLNLKLISTRSCSSSEYDENMSNASNHEFMTPNYGHGFEKLKRNKSQSSFVRKHSEGNVDLEFEFFPASSDGGSIVDDFSMLWESNQSQTAVGLGEAKKESNIVNIDVGEKSIINGISDALPFDQDIPQTTNNLYSHSIRTNSAFPNEILIHTKAELPKLQSNSDLFDSKSLISYDDNETITPSIAFFLGSNIDALRKEGISIAGVEIDDECTTCDKNINNNNNKNQNTSDFTSSDNCKCLRRRNSDGTSTHSETDDTRTHHEGFSISLSSKYTSNDTVKISELREKKRLMERSFETRCNDITRSSRFPNMIEVSKWHMSL